MLLTHEETRAMPAMDVETQGAQLQSAIFALG